MTNKLDTENIQKYYDAAEIMEMEFVYKFGQKWNIKINPQKEYDKYAIDLYCINSNKLADLKNQRTPLYTSKNKYRINPEYAFTLNVSDFLEYLIKYGNDFLIFIWVYFNESEDYGVKVKATNAVYWTTMGEILKYLQDDANNNKFINYKRRQNDLKNESQSFVLDLSSKYFHKIH